MTKYYIKEGYTEKGPLTAKEIKALKINKNTLIREENNHTWTTINNIKELKNNPSKNVLFLKLIAVFFVIAIAIFINHLQTQTNYNTFPDEIEEPLPPPPVINYTTTEHDDNFLQELFKNCNYSNDKSNLIEACDYTNPIVRNKAVFIAGQNEGKYNIGQICDIFDYCYNNWKYVNDPKEHEIVEYASNTISNGLNGDCDDFAVLVCSMILSIGGEARINYAYGPDGAHAFTEVNVGETNISEYISKRYNDENTNGEIWRRVDNDDNNWLNLDWSSKYPGGKYFDYTHGTSFYIIQQYCSDFNK